MIATCMGIRGGNWNAMRLLFIDTGAFVAQRSQDDYYHHQALVGFQEILRTGVRVVTSEHVFDETLTLLGRKVNYAFAARVGNDLLGSRLLGWINADSSDHAKAVNLMRKFADQKVSYTDALSFVLMRKEKILHAFAFDHHFVAAGFSLWPNHVVG